MSFVYRYIDTSDGLIKYVGISNGKTIRDRVADHRRSDDWYNKADGWKIEFIEVQNKSEAEAFESHLIALYGTDKWFNTAKAGWGLNHYLPTEISGWTEYVDRDRYKNWSGCRFGKLTAIRRTENLYTPSGHQRTMWEMRCDCGCTIVTDISSCVRSGKTSCGCDTKHKASIHNANNLYKHGFQSKNASAEQRRLYSKWNQMRNRCQEWDDVVSFINWAYANGYSDDKYVERIDASIPFSPDNCRVVEQRHTIGNQTKVKYLTYNDETLTVGEWAKKNRNK